MYNQGEFIIVPHKVVAQEFPEMLEAIHDILVDNKITEAPEVYAICFTLTGGREAEFSILPEHVDVNRFAGAMPPQDWMMHLYEGTMTDFLKRGTVAVYKISPFYGKLCAWVAANAKRYLVKVTVGGLPYQATLSLTVVATDEGQARSLAEAMCSGMPVVFNNDDVTIRRQVGWGFSSKLLTGKQAQCTIPSNSDT